MGHNLDVPIRYSTEVQDLANADIDGFFVGWQNPPTNAVFLTVLRNSDHRVLALDGDQLVGFIAALTDGTMCAFVTLLEVKPHYQGQGVGSELVDRIRREVGDLYAIDLVCDETVAGFYRRLGFVPTRSMSIRNPASLGRS